MGIQPSEVPGTVSPPPRVRRRWRRALISIILGLALILSGVIVIFVPVVRQGSGSRTLVYPPGDRYYILTENISGFSITGTIPVTIQWSTNGSVDVVAAACVRYCSNESQLPPGSTVYQNLLTSGSFSLNVTNGGSIFVAWFQQTDHPPTTALTYTVWTGLTAAPPVLLGLGAAVVVLGVVFLWLDVARARRSSSGSTGPS